MKIAFIHPFLFRFARGIERITQDMANSFVKKGIDVTLITWKVRESKNILKFDPRVKIHAWPTYRYYESGTIIPYYLYDLLKNNYDIVNINFSCYGEGETIFLASIFKKVRFNIIFHYPYGQVPHKYIEFKKNNLWKKASRIISTSKLVADGVKNVFDNKESEVIINGIDVDFFKNNLPSTTALRKELNLNESTPVLLTVAAFEERKGIQYVIHALPGILKEMPDAKLIISGEGSYGILLKRLLSDLNLTNNVIFCGVSNKINEFYDLADVFLLLSKGEASPMAPMEALSSGTPIITSKNRPFDEIVRDDCGIMVNEKDVEEVANAAIDLLRNKEKRMEMGKTARKYIVENFSWDKVTDKYIDIFQEELKD